MRSLAMAILASIIGVCILSYAEETKSDASAKAGSPATSNTGGPKKPKSLDVPLDVATDIIRKTNAFFQGNLEIAMPPDTDKYKNKDNYTFNAIGQKVPKATVTK